MSASKRASEQVLNRHGWLRIGGSRLARMRVNIDGKDHGYSPIELRLPQGVHSITIKKAETQEVVLRRKVNIGDHHTRSSPLKIIR